MATVSKGLSWAHGLSLVGPLGKAGVKELLSCIVVLYSTMAKKKSFVPNGTPFVGTCPTSHHPQFSFSL
jgi:hypothetical protein